jgi:hypothetical protein
MHFLNPSRYGRNVRGDYDSEADAVSIDLLIVDHWDSGGMIDDDYCTIAFSGERVANVSLLVPRDHLDLLDEAARRFELDLLGLRATTQAALAAPDHIVTVEVDPVKQPGSEAPF